MLLKNILKAFASVIIVLLTIEGLLRLDGARAVYLRESRNKAQNAQVDTIKIVCIGDSNTLLGGKDSYPSQLGEALNNNKDGYSFNVINKGLPAADSRIILEDLETWLDEEKPDIVVSMMGANDRFDLTPLKKRFHLPQALSFLEQLKVFKLLNGLYLKYARPPSDDKGAHSQPPSPAQGSEDALFEENISFGGNPVQPKHVRLFQMGLFLKNQKDDAKAEAIFRSLIAQDLELSFGNRMRRELGYILLDQGRYQDLVPLWKYWFDRYPFDVWTTDTIQDLCEQNKAREAIEPLLIQKGKEHPRSVQFIGLLGGCYHEWGEDEKAVVYMKRIADLRNQGDNPQLRDNYLRLAEILKERNIYGVFVEYPLRSIEPLKRVLAPLDDSYDFVVVENQALFKDALDPKKYKEYFIDHNYHDIGHCTPKGNRLLATNVAKEILASQSR